MNTLAESVLRDSLARIGFGDADQSEILNRGEIRVFNHRAQLVVAPIDVHRVGNMVIEAQI